MEKELHGFQFQRKPFGHQLAQLQIDKRVPPLLVVSSTNTQFVFYKINSNLTSLFTFTVSDDNSSVQSSPWQRDHCWKQANPRRRISTEFNFYYYRSPKNHLCAHPRLIARKRRRPLDPTSLLLIPESVTNYTKPIRKANGTSTGKVLNLIIDKLARLLDPNVVSPRKRILRELERVSLEDQASKRRATPQPVCTTTAPTPSPKQLSSYSITSILGEDKPSHEQGFLRNLLKPDDRQTVKYSSNNSYPRVRMDPYIGTTNAPLQHPLYGVPMLPPGPYRAPLWMHYPSPVHYPPPMPLYAPPPPHPPSPPVHHYKDYREQTLTPPSGKFLRIHYLVFIKCYKENSFYFCPV